ncbi:hypothetical protein SAMN05518684_10495 [Salipaludibacillus aurantiacus]|uniref:Uncharacterized protein n=1 Tax=Salipaludibacillus aurantiacus TaxID=1601833 RepID=A0A1H9SAT3_9BACI|nr:hypothetical protein SAMN05518684_10495 [Salipaludibacillus aurantiacus]
MSDIEKSNSQVGATGVAPTNVSGRNQEETKV